MRIHAYIASTGRRALATGIVTLTALNLAAASGLPDNPRDPPPPPTGTGHLFNIEAQQRGLPRLNNTTGKPVITGVPEVDSVLRAWRGTLSDPQGMTRADNGDPSYAYTYQWVRVDGGFETDIAGATAKTYLLTSDDSGKEVKVKVSYRDDAGFAEGPVASDAFLVSSALLVGTTGQPVAWHPATGGVYHIYGQRFTTGGSDAGYTLSSIGIEIYKPPSAELMHPPLVTVNQGDSADEPGAVIAVLRNPDSFAWSSINRFTAPPGALLEPNTSYWVVVNEGIDPQFDDDAVSPRWLNVLNTGSHAEDSDSLDDWSVRDGYAWKPAVADPWRLSTSMNMQMAIRGVLGSVQPVNYPAAGEPSILGLAQSGRWLTASPSGIYDGNGYSNAQMDGNYASYTYQWVRVAGGSEYDLPGATGAHYELTDSDVGNRVKVQARFMDDAGNTEGPLASAEYPSEGTILAADSTELGPLTQVLVDNTRLQAASTWQRVMGQRFRSGSNPDGYRLDSVGIGIAGEPSADIRVRLFRMNTNNYQPGLLIGEFGITMAKQNGVVTFPALGEVTLAPDTEYFLLVTDRSGMRHADVVYSTTAQKGQDSDVDDGWSIHDWRSWKHTIDDENWRTSSSVWKIFVKGSPLSP